jgi:hypothetical protein
MVLEHVDRFITLFFAGLGFFSIGCLNVLIHRWGKPYRIALNSIVVFSLFGVFLVSQENFSRLRSIMIILVLVLIPFFFVRSQTILVLFQSGQKRLQRSIVAYATIACIGTILLLGSVVAYDVEDQQYLTESWHELEATVYQSDMYVVHDIRVTTDRGTPIPLQSPVSPRSKEEAETSEIAFLDRTPLKNYFIHRQAANDHSNCHGWVFTAGKYCLGGSQVEAILQDNGYYQVDDPVVGDLAIYRNHLGICHTALVRYVTKGMPVLVEGKWGTLGIYLHPVDQTPYGTNFSYYRSPRDGHRLRGLGEGLSNPIEVERIQTASEFSDVP